MSTTGCSRLLYAIICLCIYGLDLQRIRSQVWLGPGPPSNRDDTFDIIALKQTTQPVKYIVAIIKLSVSILLNPTLINRPGVAGAVL